MNKITAIGTKRNFTIIILGAMMLVTVILAGNNDYIHQSYIGQTWAQQIKNQNDEAIYKELRALGEILQRVRSDYVEKPDDKKLIDGAISGMLRSLDPHSSYLNEKGYRDLKVDTKGQFGGIGIEVTMKDDYVVIVAPIEDTPGDRAGLMAEDIITHIDGSPIFGLSLSQVVEKMRGEVGTKIKLTVRRSKGKKVKIDIIRDIITIKSVKYNVEKDIGYIRLTKFSEHTSSALEKAVQNIKDKIGDEKIKGYIIDLRNNPGGLLDQAIKVSDMFLEQGEILSTQARDPKDVERFHASKGDITSGKPIVLLINGGSASASEIVAGALLDHKRAYVVGTRSFGKGSVQTVFPVGKNRAIRLTTSRYFTPSGRSIQAKGIEAQFIVKQKQQAEQVEKSGETQLLGHLSPQDSNQKQESGSSYYVPKDRKNDLQYNFAIKILLEGINAAKDSLAKNETEKNQS